jgi:alanine racemase
MTDARPAGIRRIARIDLDAFAGNVAAASTSFLDARADAYGHGLALLAPIAVDAGVVSILVSDERDADVAARFFSDVPVSRLHHPDASTAAYGFDGSGTPVMTLTGEVLALKDVEAGAGVSYGYTYRTATASTLALVGLGYADGVPRLASNRARVLVGGRLLPLVGRVAMDQFVVDCGDTAPELGGEVVLFGDPAMGAPSVQEWATETERSPLALTAGLGRRIWRTAAVRV